MRRIYNTELIEIFIPAGTTKFKIQFEDEQNLRDTKLVGLNVYTDVMVPVSMVSQRPVANFALIQHTFVTLQGYDGENFEWQKPLITLIDQETESVIQNYEPQAYTKQRVNWPKSYIEIAAGAIIPLVDTVFLFEANYILAPTKETRRKEARFRKRS